MITLCGFLAAGTTIPEEISTQLLALSRKIPLQELLISLTANFPPYAKQKLEVGRDGNIVAVADPQPIISQIEALRIDLSKIDSVNYAQIIAWIVSRAHEEKLFDDKARRR